MAWIPLASSGQALSQTTVAANTFINPIFSSFDPWVTFVNGMYYYTQSYCGAADICVKSSPTLSGLANAPWVGVWNHANNADPNGGDIWAPELHYVGGNWYIYYAADNGNNNNHRLFALVPTTANGGPTGSFTEANTGLTHGQLNESTGNWAIDPDVFVAADSNLYLTWSCTNQKNSAFPQRICLAPMSDPLTISGATVFLSAPTAYWETRDAAIQEGPVGYTRNGRTYITYSGSASWIANDYAVGLLTMAAGSSPLTVSSWTKSGPIFDHHGTTYGSGSVVFVQSLDGKQFWNLYHAIDTSTCSPAYNCRDLRMQQMFFDANGAPILGYPVNPGVALALPSGEGASGNLTTQVAAFGPAWGDAAEGNPSLGQVVGTWTYSDTFTATSSTGGAWDQIFNPGNPNSQSVSVHVEAQLVTKGTTQAYPKYGSYCTYDDNNNHAEMFIDPVYMVLATHAVVAGADASWQKTPLPAGFQPSGWHALDCVKNGSAYTFYIDEGTSSQVSQARTLHLTNGQAGLVVVDVKANYRNFLRP